MDAHTSAQLCEAREGDRPGQNGFDVTAAVRAQVDFFRAVSLSFAYPVGFCLPNCFCLPTFPPTYGEFPCLKTLIRRTYLPSPTHSAYLSHLVGMVTGRR